ncbi:hypothetical protein [uncultured Flavobacterium sp.]|uniref:hypothetical protein n=1 Tax=uncultured Flavobacterium sp. TaxID=165435 RepID=UPI00259413C3|nr:hypothetical protein [uncultured Flavobacterium sp.]
MKNFTATFVNHQYISKNWMYIQSAIIASFENAEFNNNYTLQAIVNEVSKDIISQKKSHFHIVAKNKKNEIVGAIFSIPEIKIDNSNTCHIGWFFSIPQLYRKERLFVSDLMINKAHAYLRNLGYTAITTEIGTVAGERLLTKKYGYKKTNNSEWIKYLI